MSSLSIPPPTASPLFRESLFKLMNVSFDELIGIKSHLCQPFSIVCHRACGLLRDKNDEIAFTFSIKYIVCFRQIETRRKTRMRQVDDVVEEWNWWSLQTDLLITHLPRLPIKRHFCLPQLDRR